MTIQFGRVLLRELVTNERTMEFTFRRHSTISTSSINFSSPLSMFTSADVERCCTKIHRIEYKEVVRLSYGVNITPLSSGFCLGSCLWLLESPDDRLAYVPAASGDLNRHPKELDFAPLIDCDTLLITDIRPERDPHATTEHTVELMLAAVNRVLDRGGVCVIPTTPCGVLFDLIEAVYAVCIYPRRQQQSTPNPPLSMYLCLPNDSNIIELTQCGAEWLCEKKIEKLYNGEQAFLHESLEQSQVLHVVSELSTTVINGLQVSIVAYFCCVTYVLFVVSAWRCSFRK